MIISTKKKQRQYTCVGMNFFVIFKLNNTIVAAAAVLVVVVVVVVVIVEDYIFSK